ncbi:DUF4912 domain-containing protein [Aporhodopirellula aestuarii]|uniref:DUF4912 domain-containing protein n=1 Tax=Aporhodopirellula aestuarii TaxID=2950107 RepID=A0ABT0UA51_9BACT|nr:DUF4912 domain-containing protein [Aporhodopirellula aestuarii]MCM2373773.1 DUF4912 domain-containing protein [Aporhodopirellula aestuarii]
MITNADLSSQTRRELAELAKNYGIAGWHSMRKDDLVSEITKIQRRLRRQVSEKKATASTKKETAAKTSTAKTSTAKRRSGDVISRSSPGSTAKRVTLSSSAKSESSKKVKKPIMTTTALSASSSSGSSTKSSGVSGRSKARKPVSRNDVPLPELSEPKVSAKTLRIRAEMRRRRELMQKRKDLSTSTLVGGAAVTDGAERHRSTTPHRDRIVLLVRDSFWLQASWEITQSSVQRAQSALAERWHSAVPTVRLLSVGDVSSNRAETVSRDIPVHGGVSTWYIDVQDPPSRYRVAIGYLTESGEFHCLCRSNVVETPVPGDCERLDEHWQDIAEDYERIYALSGGLESGSGELREAFEGRLQRRMPYPADSGSMTGDPSLLRQSKLRLDVEAELIVYGKSDPTASVMVSGHPVKLQKDGAFTVRLEFPDKRQVLPITAETRDGLRQRTTVIAVERNTKVMDTVELQENN